MAKGFNRTEMNQRLAKDQKFAEYRDRREAYKRDGVSDRIAWKIAAALTEPPPGEPPYFILDADLVEKAEKVLNAPLPPPPPTNHSGSGIRYGPQSEPNPNATPEWNEHVKEVNSDSSTWAARWAELAEKVEVGRKASALAIVQWVFDQAGTPPEKIVADEVPSLGALKYLRHVQSSESNYAAFVKDNWAKIIPSRQQLEYEARFHDDGRELFDKLAAFEQSLLLDEEDEEDRSEAEVEGGISG